MYRQEEMAFGGVRPMLALGLHANIVNMLVHKEHREI